MSYTICKENCEPRTLVTEEPIKQIDRWHRLRDIDGFISFRDEANMWITAKEQIQFVYEILYDTNFRIFYIEKVYDPKEVDTNIEEFYSNLPDTREIKFLTSDILLDEDQVYMIDQDETDDFEIFDELQELYDAKGNQETFVYSADVVGNMLMINGRLDMIEDLLLKENIIENEDNDKMCKMEISFWDKVKAKVRGFKWFGE